MIVQWETVSRDGVGRVAPINKNRTVQSFSSGLQVEFYCFYWIIMLSTWMIHARHLLRITYRTRYDKIDFVINLLFYYHSWKKSRFRYGEWKGSTSGAVAWGGAKLCVIC